MCSHKYIYLSVYVGMVIKNMEIRCKDCNELLAKVDEKELDRIKENWYVEQQERQAQHRGKFTVMVCLVGGHVECKSK